MEFTVQQIASILEGKIVGNASAKIHTLSKIEEGMPGSISFLSNPKYEPYLYTTQASAIIISDQYTPKKEIGATLILVKDPYTAFTVLLNEYNRLLNNSKEGIEQPSFIASSSTVGEHIYVGAFAYIGHNCTIGNHVRIYPQAYIGDNVQIGDYTVVHSGVKVYSGSIIGKNCILHAGVVIGSDGFGFAPQPDGSYKPIPQVGNVILHDNVSIGANTVIDCATLGSTIIREGVKLDNLIQIAHNVEIGKNTVIAAQTGVSGSTKIGENCVVGGQVGFVGHIRIADKTSVGAQSGIGKSITKPGTAVQGSPAFDYKENLKSQVIFRKLPLLLKKLDDLEEKILNLSDKT
jgi:UDP-3-O-[3-hydroxymyristoyl] glucosamine N-acyltransferase